MSEAICPHAQACSYSPIFIRTACSFLHLDVPFPPVVTLAHQITDFCASVSVLQRFENFSTSPVEAVYEFPLDDRVRARLGVSARWHG